MDIRKYGITIAVAILAAILIYSVADAIAPSPEWKDCYGSARGYVQAPSVPSKQLDMNGRECTSVPPIDRAAEKTCVDDKGQYQAVLDGNGCAASYECSYCQKQFDELTQVQKMTFFYVALGLGILFIIIGFLLPLGTIHEWVGLGFIIGGVIGLFIGTVSYWSDLSRWMRPLVIVIELAVVLFIIYRRMQDAPTHAVAPAVVLPPKTLLPVKKPRTGATKKR